MEQLYMIEVFVDTVTIFIREGEEKSVEKNLIARVKFGPDTQFIFKQNQLAVGDKKDGGVECDELGRTKFSKTLRTGKSYLFPSFPETILSILANYPLEVEVWNDDEIEDPILVGAGIMIWDKSFVHMVKENTEVCKQYLPLTIKEKVVLYEECCCRVNGEVSIIVRLSPLGNTIVTDFQQLMNTPDHFVFRTNKTPSIFDCKKIEDGGNKDGSLYQQVITETPQLKDATQNTIHICTDLQSCGIKNAPGAKNASYECHKIGETVEGGKKICPIDKIKMGEITGPCGNTNCALAHRVKTYLRNLDSYKKKAGTMSDTKDKPTKKVCGACLCNDDKYHTGTELEQQPPKIQCSHCGGATNVSETCDDRANKLYGTGVTPEESESNVTDKKKPDTIVNYVFHVTRVPTFKDAVCRNTDTVIEELYNTEFDAYAMKSFPNKTTACYYQQDKQMSTNVTTNAASKDSRKQTIQIYNCTGIQDVKDCRCKPPQPSPPCKAFNCECLAEGSSKSRKMHKTYCPSYRHKTSCPNNINNVLEEKKEDDEDDTEPLPYGLPPVKLGPCPVVCKPCSTTDGFARMYKNAQLPTQPRNIDDFGKVCCSREYNKIKEALKEYMKYEMERDARCLTSPHTDTEKRCCDKEQQLMPLIGKSCCGTHKLAIQEKYKE